MSTEIQENPPFLDKSSKIGHTGDWNKVVFTSNVNLGLQYDIIPILSHFILCDYIFS